MFVFVKGCSLRVTLQVHKGESPGPVRGVDEGFVCFSVHAMEGFIDSRENSAAF